MSRYSDVVYGSSVRARDPAGNVIAHNQSQYCSGGSPSHIRDGYHAQLNVSDDNVYTSPRNRMQSPRNRTISHQDNLNSPSGGGGVIQHNYNNIPVPQKCNGTPTLRGSPTNNSSPTHHGSHAHQLTRDNHEEDTSLKYNLSNSAHATLAMFEQAGGPIKASNNPGLILDSEIHGNQGHVIKQTTTTFCPNQSWNNGNQSSEDPSEPQTKITTIINRQDHPTSPDGPTIMHTVQQPLTSQSQPHKSPSTVYHGHQRQVLHQAVATSATSAATTTVGGQAIVGQVCM